MDEQITLSTSDLQVLSELDSRQFGFIKLKEEQHAKKRALALKAIRYLERVIIRVEEQKRKNKTEDDNNNAKGKNKVDPKVYCKLGHLHLLLQDYCKSLSAYQKYYNLVDDHWKDPCFLYGVGLVYFQYNAYQWATRAFRQVLYVDPGFSRANEVHLRLGWIAKINNDFETGIKHYQLALNDKSPCTFSRLEIRFHISHLHELQGKFSLANTEYEALLEEAELPVHLKADIYRQLGWMYHSVDSLGEKPGRIHSAIQCLNKSIECDPKSGQSLYLLGRCYASIGKVHEAFIAYRNSVDKSESNADTWCSIGVLYQQQNQPMDALQAYICAVQLDKDHAAAWTNLGILYESAIQPIDALACYTNATRNKTLNPNLHQRIKYLRTQLSNAPPLSTSNRQKQLPSVEEAWNLPISNEMTNRQPNQGRGGKPDGGPAAKRLKTDEKPPFYLNQQQLQTLQCLQQQPNLTPQQHQLMVQLQTQFRLMQQHQQQMRLQQQQQLIASRNAATANNPFENNPLKPELPQASSTPQAPVSDLLADLQNKDLANMSDGDLAALISEQDFDSLAENLLKQFQADGGDNIDLDIKTEGEDKSDKEDKKDDADAIKPCEVRVSSLDIPTKLEVIRDNQKQLKLNIEMSGNEIIELCHKIGPVTGNISSSVLPENSPPPNPPDRPKTSLTKEQLLPPTPSVYLENKKDAFSPQLQDFCLQRPITVVRGIAAALKLDLGLFSTKTLVEQHHKHPVEIRSQLKQSADENWDAHMTHQVWDCASTKSHTTIGKYAQYQASTFQESLREEQDKGGLGAHARAEAELGRKRRNNMYLKFGTNVDLSDNRRWRNQLTELTKLPAWSRVVSAGNMLSHLGHQLTGMNTVHLAMNVPCARISAHQEPNNFCAVNINIGPGDCEWFGVPHEYWGALEQLCEKHGVNYLRGSWWPNMKDLMDEEIPVYRFLQRPGDLVFVNSGCVHWVQAAGWSNNISWNVGPMTPLQYNLALERYEWNKLQSYKSVVAMTFLSWNLARNVRISDKKLFNAIKHTLLRTIRYTVLTLDFVKSKGMDVKYHGRQRGEPAHYCGQCENEVFVVLFVREEHEKHVITCLDCSRRKDPDLKGFVCLEEFRLSELVEIYDSFRLHPPPVPHTPPTPASAMHMSAPPTVPMISPTMMQAASAASQMSVLASAMSQYSSLMSTPS